jgi:hypothetical protein
MSKKQSLRDMFAQLQRKSPELAREITALIRTGEAEGKTTDQIFAEIVQVIQARSQTPKPPTI